MKVVCIGDSIVNGFPFPQKYGWPALVEKATGWEMINMGLNGDNSAHVLMRFDHDVLTYDPDMVIILTGANDFVFGMDGPEGVTSNIMGMVDKALAEDVVPVLCSPILTDPEMAAVKWAPADYYATNRMILQLRKLLAERCEEKGLFLLDPLPAYEECAQYTDGIHPTRDGYRFLADFIARELTDNFADME